MAKMSGGAQGTIADPAVAAVFDGYPEPLRGRLLALRALILDVAAETEGVGAVEETLKWGQPSYLTPETKSGSTVRIDAVKGEPPRYAAYFHCQSGLVDSFRALYPDGLTFAGDRAIVLGVDEMVPEAALRHCIALALTHHRRKGRGRAR